MTPISRPLTRGPSRAIAGLLAVALIAALAAAIQLIPRGNAPPLAPAPAPTPTIAKLTARGQVRPIAQARVATIGGGVVQRLPFQVGDWIDEGNELARIRGVTGDIEVVSAPWSGTITASMLNVGDTVTPGATVATLGDMSRLRVETTDVDEFIIGSVARGQLVTLTIDALDNRELRGIVRTVTLLPQTTSGGDEHYPVVIDLDDQPTELRPGMTARVQFPR